MDSDSYSKQQLDDLFMDMIAYYDGDVTVTMEISTKTVLIPLVKIWWSF